MSPRNRNLAVGAALASAGVAVLLGTAAQAVINPFDLKTPPADGPVPVASPGLPPGERIDRTRVPDAVPSSPERVIAPPVVSPPASPPQNVPDTPIAPRPAPPRVVAPPRLGESAAPTHEGQPRPQVAPQQADPARALRPRRAMPRIAAPRVYEPEALTGKRQPRLRLWVIKDPQAPGANRSVWENGAGLPDMVGGGRNAVRLQKFTGTFTNSGAGAEVMGVEGHTLTELGFDTRNDGYTGAGTPRFMVYTVDGPAYAFSHRQGGVWRPKTPVAQDPARWTRFRFRNADAYPRIRGQAPWPGFGNVRIKKIDIVFDEGLDRGKGYTYIDNVNVNGSIIGGPND